MLSSAAPDLESSSQSVPCPSCGGETTEEFVANGPSKGLRTTCQSCGPIDVMSVSVLDLPDEGSDDAATPFRFEEPAAPGSGEELSLVVNEPEAAPTPDPAFPTPGTEERESTTGGFTFAPRAAAPEPEPVVEELPEFDDGAGDGSSLRENASRILEEAGAPANVEPEANDRIAQVGGAVAPMEMTPGVAVGRVRHARVDAAGKSRNRQVTVVAFGGIAAIVGLVGLDLYLRPLHPGTGVAHVAAPVTTSAAPAEIEPPAAPEASSRAAAPPAASGPSAAESPRHVAAKTKATGTAPERRAAARAAAAPAPKPAPVARATSESARRAPEPTGSRWYSQTGVPPTRQNAILGSGTYAADAAAAPAAVPANDPRAAARRTVIREEVAARPPVVDDHPEWRKLRPGMSAEEVVERLGRPRWRSRSVALEFWMYEQQSIMGSGVVVFDNRGVYSWREPSRPLPPG